MIKRALHISFILVLLGLVLLFPAFVAKERAQKTCVELRISNTGQHQEGILSPEDVRTFIHTRFMDVVGHPVNRIQSDTLETLLSTNPYISDVEVYADINGILFVDYAEEEPILRIFNQNDRTAFISRRGRLLPLKAGFTTRLPIASGDLGAVPAPGTMLQPKDNPLLYNLLEFGRILSEDEFLWNLIDQIYVNDRGELMLMPRLGDYSITFGKAEDTKQKLDNLKLFYHKGLSQGAWDRFSSISLQYKDQIVCTKR